MKRHVWVVEVWDGKRWNVAWDTGLGGGGSRGPAVYWTRERARSFSDWFRMVKRKTRVVPYIPEPTRREPSGRRRGGKR